MNDQEERLYELVYVIQPKLDEQEIAAVEEQLAQSIKRQNGSIKATEIWGKRNLAYPIKNYYEGYYIVHQIQMPGSGLAGVELTLRYNEDVLRYMHLRMDET